MAGSCRTIARRAGLRPLGTNMTLCSTRSAVVATGVTATLAGSRRKASASDEIVFGMVAEKNRVWRSFGSMRHDALQRMDEAEIEHLVGLVEDEDLDIPQAQRPAVDEVEEAAGRGDEDVDAAASARSCLPMVTPPNTTAVEAEVAPIGAEAVGDLARELAGRAEHQHPAGLRSRLRARPGGAGSAARRPPSCRCRSGRCRRGRGRRAQGEWPAPGSGWASGSPRPQAPSGSAGPIRNR